MLLSCFVLVVLTVSCSGASTEVFCWGSNAWGMNGNHTGIGYPPASGSLPGYVQWAITPPEVVKLATGAAGRHAGVIASDGTIYMWGCNSYAGCGRNTGGGSVWKPTEPVWSYDPKPASGFKDIAVGVYHTAACDNDGVAYGWGNNLNGQTGIGSTSLVQNPRKVSWTVVSPEPYIVAVSCGVFFTMYLDVNGVAYAVGVGFSGQLGGGSTADTLTPLPCSVSSVVTAISAGYDFSMFLTADGTVLVSGSNGNYQLGTGSRYGSVATPQEPVFTVSVPKPGNGFLAVSGGEKHALALGADTLVYGWGLNGNGQVGTGDATFRANPVYVMASAGVPLSGISQIRAGQFNSIARQGANGPIYAWGANGDNQLGYVGAASYYPVTIGGVAPGIHELTASYNAFCLIRGDLVSESVSMSVTPTVSDSSTGTPTRTVTPTVTKSPVSKSPTKSPQSASVTKSVTPTRTVTRTPSPNP